VQVQLLVSVLRRRTWRHELQHLDANEKVSSPGCGGCAVWSPDNCCRAWTLNVPELLLVARRVNVQLGRTGSAAAVHVDADSSWKHKCSEEGGDNGASGSSSGAELRGWRVRVVQALTIAAVAMCIWALVESILSTHGSAQKFWDVIDEAQQQVSLVASKSSWLMGSCMHCCLEKRHLAWLSVPASM
jgi:hypothetical protein